MPAHDLPSDHSRRAATPVHGMPASELRVPPRPPLPATVPADATTLIASATPPTDSPATPPASRRTFLRDPRTYLVAYAVALAAIAFWPTPVDRDAGPLLRVLTRLIPVLTYPRIEFLANVLMFVPLGLLLTLILLRARWLVLPIVILATVTIECVQAVLLDARTPSVLDIVANTTGGCLGILLAVFVESLRAGRRDSASDGR